MTDASPNSMEQQISKISIATPYFYDNGKICSVIKRYRPGPGHRAVERQPFLFDHFTPDGVLVATHYLEPHDEIPQFPLNMWGSPE